MDEPRMRMVPLAEITLPECADCTPQQMCAGCAALVAAYGREIGASGAIVTWFEELGGAG